MPSTGVVDVIVPVYRTTRYPVGLLEAGAIVSVYPLEVLLADDKELA